MLNKEEFNGDFAPVAIDLQWWLFGDLSDDDEQKLSDFAPITMNLPWWLVIYCFK